MNNVVCLDFFRYLKSLPRYRRFSTSTFYISENIYFSSNLLKKTIFRTILKYRQKSNYTLFFRSSPTHLIFFFSTIVGFRVPLFLEGYFQPWKTPTGYILENKLFPAKKNVCVEPKNCNIFRYLNAQKHGKFAKANSIFCLKKGKDLSFLLIQVWYWVLSQFERLRNFRSKKSYISVLIGNVVEIDVIRSF